MFAQFLMALASSKRQNPNYHNVEVISEVVAPIVDCKKVEEQRGNEIRWCKNDRKQILNKIPPITLCLKLTKPTMPKSARRWWLLCGLPSLIAKRLRNDGEMEQKLL